jgi:hypothetical protein
VPSLTIVPFQDGRKVKAIHYLEQHMGSKLKLDLHTHCREATACPTPTLSTVKRIVAAVKSRGLDGVAITEHYTERYGY